MNPSDPTLTCASQDEWEAWLQTHCGSSPGIWLRLARKSSAQVTLTYAEALDSALCFGWIDGQKKAESDEFWLQRFSPRKAKSIWSKINTEMAQALAQAGRMRPSGLRETELAQGDGRWERAYASASRATVPNRSPSGARREQKGKGVLRFARQAEAIRHSLSHQ